MCKLHISPAKSHYNKPVKTVDNALLGGNVAGSHLLQDHGVVFLR